MAKAPRKRVLRPSTPEEIEEAAAKTAQRKKTQSAVRKARSAKVTAERIAAKASATAKEATKTNKQLVKKYGEPDAVPTKSQKLNRLKAIIEPETEAMVQVMIDIAKNTDHKNNPDQVPSIHASIRLEAADRVLSRAYGKPKEVVEHTGDDDTGGGDEVMKLLNNIFEAVGVPTIDEGAGDSAAQS